jgi:2-dehydropantoate 2-reductase
MRVAIVGAGAIGGLLGARLALAGEDVTFIARNRNLAAIAAHGFRLIDEAGVEHHAATAKAVGDAAAIGAQDLVLLTVKAHQVKDVLAQLGHLVGPATMLVTMINGMPWWYFQGLRGEWQGRTLESVDPGGVLASAIDPARVIGAIVYPAAELVAPGVVRAIEGNRFTIGEPGGERTSRIEALSKALMSAGFKAPIARDIRAEIWVKLWGNLSFNPVSALTGATLEAICRDADGHALVATMMKEAEAVANRLGVTFKISIEQRIAGAEAVGAHKTSMLQDVLHGRPIEVEALVGSVVELAGIVGVAVPTIEAVYRAVKLLARTPIGERAAASVTEAALR